MTKRGLGAKPAPQQGRDAMPQAPSEPQATIQAPVPVPNFEELSRNMALLVEEAGKATAAYLKPLDQRQAKSGLPDQVSEVVKTLGQVAEYWLVAPPRGVAAPTRRPPPPLYPPLA